MCLVDNVVVDNVDDKGDDAIKHLLQASIADA